MVNDHLGARNRFWRRFPVRLQRQKNQPQYLVDDEQETCLQAGITCKVQWISSCTLVDLAIIIDKFEVLNCLQIATNLSADSQLLTAIFPNLSKFDCHIQQEETQSEFNWEQMEKYEIQMPSNQAVDWAKRENGNLQARLWLVHVKVAEIKTAKTRLVERLLIPPSSGSCSVALSDKCAMSRRWRRCLSPTRDWNLRCRVARHGLMTGWWLQDACPEYVFDTIDELVVGSLPKQLINQKCKQLVRYLKWNCFVDCNQSIIICAFIIVASSDSVLGIRETPLDDITIM